VRQQVAQRAFGGGVERLQFHHLEADAERFRQRPRA
jgi:hypothetical protein